MNHGRRPLETDKKASPSFDAYHSERTSPNSLEYMSKVGPIWQFFVLCLLSFGDTRFPNPSFYCSLATSKKHPKLPVHVCTEDHVFFFYRDKKPYKTRENAFLPNRTVFTLPQLGRFWLGNVVSIPLKSLFGKKSRRL